MAAPLQDPGAREGHLVFDPLLLPELPPLLADVLVLPPPVLVELPAPPMLPGLALPPLIVVPALPMPLEPARLVEPLWPVLP